MTNLYEIPEEIQQLFYRLEDLEQLLVDPETGEVNQEVEKAIAEVEIQIKEGLDADAKAKAEWCALYYKNKNAEAEALKNEERTFTARRRKAEKQADWAKRMCDYFLGGQKHSTTKVAMTYRKSKTVEFDEGASIDDIDERWVRVKVNMELAKPDIKKAIDAGEEIKGLHLEEHNNLSIR